jgi:hypothetical protein
MRVTNERHIVLPYLTDREVDGIVDAICDGRLVAVADTVEKGITAVASPEVADLLVKHDDDAAGELLEELREANRELDNLRQIMREVLAEKDPSDFEYRLDDAIDDVRKGIDGALTIAEDMENSYGTGAPSAG